MTMTDPFSHRLARRDDLWRDLQPDDLPGDLAEIGRALGMDAVRYLVRSWGGTQIYIHVEEAVLRAPIRAHIRAHWSGRNEGELAEQLGVPRRVVLEALRGSDAPPDPSQLALL